MNRYKIVGISKNFVPSVDHLLTPYFLLLLKDKEKYLIKKTFKEYKLGEYFFFDENIEKEV